MGVPIAGFIAAVILAALVLAWIAFCMFCRERHKPEHYQYNISDLKRRNIELAQENDSEKATKVGVKEMAAGIFILPSRRKQKSQDYEKRPDYPESPAPVLQPNPANLVGIFNDDVADIHFKDGIYEIDSSSQYHSEV